MAKSDGDIYRFLRIEQCANRQINAQALRLQLSPCKEKILNQLLKREPPEGYQDSIVDALDALLPYPGVWEGLELANWHRYLALHWDEPIIHFLQKHLHATYEKILQGVIEAERYFDIETVRKLALRCPQNKSDALFIQKSMKDGKLFHGLQDQASRTQILNNILSLKVIIPSLKTFHENMKYFAIGVKILREHILSEDDAEAQHRSFEQRLQWSEPPEARVDAGDGNFASVERLGLALATKALFLSAIKIFPYVSHDRPKIDVRGEKVMEPTVNDGFVYLLCKEARRLGFCSTKVEVALAGDQPVCCRQYFVDDPQVGSKWKCGKPGLRAFLHLYKNASLPALGLVEGRKGLLPMFVAKDFLDAFFGPDAFADDGFLEDADMSGPSSSSAIQEQITEVEVDMEDAPGPISGVPHPQIPVTDVGERTSYHHYGRGRTILKTKPSRGEAGEVVTRQRPHQKPTGHGKRAQESAISRRSRVCPPERWSSNFKDLGTAKDEVQHKAPKDFSIKSSRKEEDKRKFKLRRVPDTKGRSRERGKKVFKKGKTQKRLSTFNPQLQLGKPSRSFSRDVSFADTKSAFTAAASSNRKRNIVHVDREQSLRQWISNKSYERPPKRRKHQQMDTSITGVAAGGIPSAQTVSVEREINIHNSASNEPEPRQRSPIFAPTSSTEVPVLGPTSELETDGKPETKPTKNVLQGEGRSQMGQPATQAQRFGQESAGQESQVVETFSETRTGSPGLTYIQEEWGADRRSPILAPQFDPDLDNIN